MYTYFIDISWSKSIEVDFETLYTFMPILIESTTIEQDAHWEKHYVRGLIDIDNEQQMKLVKEFNEWEDKNGRRKSISRN